MVFPYFPGHYGNRYLALALHQPRPHTAHALPVGFFIGRGVALVTWATPVPWMPWPALRGLWVPLALPRL